MAGADLSYVTNEDYKSPDSNPWGVGGVPSEKVTPYGQASTTEGDFYDGRDDMVGGTDTQWNEGSDHVSGSNWASAGDTAAVFNASAGLGGERTKFSGTLSAADLAEEWSN